MLLYLQLENKMNMVKDDVIIKQLKELYKVKEILTKEDINKVYQEVGINLTDTALRKRVYNLKQKGILNSIRSGTYTIVSKCMYKPEIDYFINKVRRIFTGSYQDVKYCIWSTAWLHDFMVHQPFNWFYIFEVEKDMLETAFYLFKDNNINAFNSPDKSILETYATEEKRAVIIKNLTSRSPILNAQKNKVPTTEKMLIDTFCDKDIFYFYQGVELVNIFEQAIERYQINFSALLNYAAQRGKKEEIRDLLINKVQINKNLLP